MVEVAPSPLGTRMEELLATLPEPQRAALLLRYQEDLTPEEIATTLAAPLPTVKSNLQRGLKLLRAKAASHLQEFVRTKSFAAGETTHGETSHDGRF
jgi:RNA polymerase sigma-70 factor (ECF subfamily)